MHDIDTTALLDFVFSHYHESLKSSERAHQFLQAIGFDQQRYIEQLYLGYSDRTLGFQLPDRATAEGAAIRGALVRLGLLKASGHELLRGCVVFPLRRSCGAVIGSYAFLLKEFEHAGRLKPLSWVADFTGNPA